MKRFWNKVEKPLTLDESLRRQINRDLYSDVDDFLRHDSSCELLMTLKAGSLKGRCNCSLGAEYDQENQ